MSEIENNSLDLIITSPPYNIGTVYGDVKDDLEFSVFKNLLSSVSKESFRTLKDTGRLIIECADTVKIGDLYVELSGMFQSLCLKEGFSIESRFINFVSTDKGVELLEHDWNEDYTTKNNAHSNCHQIMVFSKSKVSFDSESEVLYLNYKSSVDHPCPTPEGIYTFILDKYFKLGYRVLDTFMGTARLGVQVLERGGDFFGYELDTKIFQVAEDNMSRVK
jgi:site-specific DNA-methyltransferase (adenine-specific)